MTDSQLSLDFTKEQEEWKPIPGYEGYYSASTLGRIRRDKAYGGTFAGRILIPQEDGRGYYHVGLYVRNTGKTQLIHKLVSLTFIGLRPDGYCVNHKDGIKTNNRLSNLEYVTRLQNMQHAVDNDLMSRGLDHYSYKHPEKTLKGEQHPMSKLKEKDVKYIRLRYSKGNITVRVLAKQYNVVPSTILGILDRKIWAHI